MSIVDLLTFISMILVGISALITSIYYIKKITKNKHRSTDDKE